MASEGFDYEYCITDAKGDPIVNYGGGVCWMGARQALQTARRYFSDGTLGRIHRRPLGDAVGLVDLVMGIESADAKP